MPEFAKSEASNKVYILQNPRYPDRIVYEIYNTLLKGNYNIDNCNVGLAINSGSITYFEISRSYGGITFIVKEPILSGQETGEFGKFLDILSSKLENIKDYSKLLVGYYKSERSILAHWQFLDRFLKQNKNNLLELRL